MDCDNTHNPLYIIDLLEKAINNKGIDVVIASRYRDNSKIIGLSFFRRCMSNIAKLIYTTSLNIENVKDYTCGYRLYTKDIIEKSYAYFGESIIKEKGFACMPELLYKLYFIGAKFEEIPFELSTKHILSHEFNSAFLQTATNFFKLYMPFEFGVPVLIISFIGLFLCMNKKNLSILLWFISFAVESIAIVAIYLIFLSPIFAVLCGIAADKFKVKHDLANNCLLVCFLLLFSINSYLSVSQYFIIDKKIEIQTK